jgi:hypothetical protein
MMLFQYVLKSKLPVCPQALRRVDDDRQRDRQAV